MKKKELFQDPRRVFICRLTRPGNLEILLYDNYNALLDGARTRYKEGKRGDFCTFLHVSFS